MAGIDFTGENLAERIKSAYMMFVNVAIPAAVAGIPPAIALAANSGGWKTPVIADNPNAFWLGCTTAGWDIALDEQIQEDFCDEFPDPESTTITSRKLTVSGSALGVLSPKILKTLYGLPEFSVDGDAFRHFGASTSVSKPTCNALLIYRRETAPDVFKYGYFFFPNCEQTGAYPGGKLSSKERLVAPIKLLAKGYTPYGGKPYTKYFEE